ncbi:MAG TPA: hypothetical protein VJ747_12325 [Stellaceae bacterium]|nr:hypothetical protein [Stellaceae bacterium]
MSPLRILLASLACLAPIAAGAAPRNTDPDWPCQQALVPEIAPAMIWAGPSLDGIGDWHQQPQVTALVERATPRSVSRQQGEAAIDDFTKGLSGDRNHLITLAFAGLLDETNRQRGEVIERIKDLAQRQRGLADIIARLTAQVDAAPAPKPGETPSPERTELVERWTFTQRSYTSLQQTMRYACEVPGQLDARLGAYARALQAALSS